MDIVIRYALFEDIDTLNSLFKKLLEYERENYDNNITYDLNINSFFNKRIGIDDNIILVAELNNEIIGYIFATIDSDNKIKKDIEATINSIYICELYRNKGIGTKLIEEIVSILKNRNIKYLFIDNLIENKTAKYLYEKLDFKVFREDRRKELK